MFEDGPGNSRCGKEPEIASRIPQVVRDLTVQFYDNEMASVEVLLATHPDLIACLIMESR